MFLNDVLNQPKIPDRLPHFRRKVVLFLFKFKINDQVDTDHLFIHFFICFVGPLDPILQRIAHICQCCSKKKRNNNKRKLVDTPL